MKMELEPKPGSAEAKPQGTSAGSQAEAIEDDPAEEEAFEDCAALSSWVGKPKLDLKTG